MPLGDQRQRLFGQQRVAQQQAVNVEHGAQLARGVGRQGVGQQQQFLLRVGQRLGQAAAFGGDIFRRDAVMRHFQRRGAHDHGAPDGVTASHALAVQTTGWQRQPDGHVPWDVTDPARAAPEPPVQGTFYSCSPNLLSNRVSISASASSASAPEASRRTVTPRPRPAS